MALEWNEYLPQRWQLDRDHGSWQVTSRASEPTWNLRYGRVANKYGVALPEPIGHFASPAEAMLAVEIYEEVFAGAGAPDFTMDAAFKVNPYNNNVFAGHVDGLYLTFVAAVDSVYIDLEEDGADGSTPIGGFDSSVRKDEASHALCLIDRPPGLTDSRHLDAAILMEIMDARRKANGLSTPLTMEDLAAWRQARRPDAPVPGK